MENGLLTQFEGVKDINKGSLVVLAARPFFGKTTFSYNIAFDMIENNQKVKIYSFEREKEIIEDMLRTKSKHKYYNQKNINIDFNPDNTIEDILNNSDNYDLIIIETLQLIKDEDVINKLKDLATRTNSVVLLISELPKEIDERKDKHPRLIDIDDNIVKHVDIVLLMYGDYYYKEDYSKGRIINLKMIDINNNNAKKYKLLMHQDRITFTNYKD
ncbi:MAG: hypothetical protein J6G98_03280 [Bacilli bacterium]|nr:hypothetical protein [Bacilli bacterium]